VEPVKYDNLRGSPVILAFASGNEKRPPSRMQMQTQAKVPLILHCFQYQLLSFLENNQYFFEVMNFNRFVLNLSGSFVMVVF
jgi:hypothetical protein